MFAPNPRGSIGWGQEFIDDITATGGASAYEDIMRGTDYAEALPYVEKGRTAAAGASYGGYMVNWIAGHTDRYPRARLATTASSTCARCTASTEELWFVDWEFGGPLLGAAPRSTSARARAASSPSFKTPTLVIHGEQDYRVPLEQGLGDVHRAAAARRARRGCSSSRTRTTGC